ncbi:T9SS type B sorting domain-containing protein [Ulvibacter antarcticus]|uniref:Protein involved in gliding motility SprC n=1 Tax=Ulvibacter antarcticus TaxID=442714 RepID=A0A3L9YVL5_9FLAO|nr:gliding motility-associated C-terminal domain-containing protein [Ulvibacter antarcticus]RMA64364.1 protein involved in gliding motility SprC [Ulvibacter antarcticus]
MAKTNLPQFVLSVCSFFSVVCIGTMNAQIVIGTPNLEFSQACANESFNTFGTTFMFSPETGVDPSNQFIVELSDDTGDFSNPSEVFTSNPGSIIESPAIVYFSIPTTTTGEGYKIRIKSTNPEAISTASQSFPAYYKLQDSPFTINNMIANASFCPGGSYLLTIDNPGTGDNDSPLNYPSLTYNWYKEITSTTFALVAQTPTLTVSQEGIYFVETNYGSCTSNSFSNRVTVTAATSGEVVDATINSSLGNPFCAANGPTTLSTINGNSHTWFKDGIIIPGATSQTYITDISGLYSVKVDFGSCEASGSLELETGDFTSSIDVDENNLLETGDSLTITISSDAINPEFTWLLDEEEIPNASQNTFTATNFGTYRVLVTQTSGCIMTIEHEFHIEELYNPFPEVAHIPNLISPNGDGINDTWILPTQYVSGTNTEVVIISAQGETVMRTNDYFNNWPEDVLTSNEVYYYYITPINEQPKKGFISIIK